MTQESAGDRALVERLIDRRDPIAFRDLYRRYTPSLYAMAVRLSQRNDVAEDIVHDTWIRAIDGLPRFAWRSTLLTWLTGILINCMRERFSRVSNEAILDDADADRECVVELPDIVDTIELERALASLANGYREVLVLHDVQGFTHNEIAQLLGIEPGTSKSQLARARRALRRVLRED
jgi:RNA polymerase sigma-70 factor, ECF subfamily